MPHAAWILKFVSLILVSFVGIAAANAQVTYDKLVFKHEQNGLNPNGRITWTQLTFRVEGIKINGHCYQSCSTRFSLDSHLGTKIIRYDVGIYGGKNMTVSSSFPPQSRWPNGTPQVFVGTSRMTTSLRKAIKNFSGDERLFIAWIIANSAELIEFASLQKNGIQPLIATQWASKKIFFEEYVRNALPEVKPEIALLDRNSENTNDQLLSIIQPALIELGFYSGAIDGKVGPATKEAIKAFERSRNDLANGYVDTKELAYLKNSIKSAAQQVKRTDYSVALTETEKLRYRTKIQRLEKRISLLKNNEDFRAQLESRVFELRHALVTGQRVAAIAAIQPDEVMVEGSENVEGLKAEIAQLKKELASTKAAYAESVQRERKARSDLTELKLPASQLNEPSSKAVEHASKVQSGDKQIENPAKRKIEQRNKE